MRIGIAFGSGGSQSLPATEWPGVSSWLVCFFLSYLILFIYGAFVEIYCTFGSAATLETVVPADVKANSMIQWISG